MVNKRGMVTAVQGRMSLEKGWETTNVQNHFLINSCCLLVTDAILSLLLPINKAVSCFNNKCRDNLWQISADVSVLKFDVPRHNLCYFKMR